MGAGASKTTSRGKKDNKKLKPARSKLRAAVALAKQSSVPGLSNRSFANCIFFWYLG